MKFAAIASWAADNRYDVAFMCEQLGVSRSGYYKWLGSSPSDREKTDATLASLIRSLHADSRGNAGVRRIAAGCCA